MNYKSYLGRLSDKKDIEGLALLTKEFIKELLSLHAELTFTELAGVVKKKKKAEPISVELSKICQMFEDLEYRPKKPSKQEIEELKALIKQAVKKVTPQDQKDNKKSIFQIIKAKASIRHKKKEKEKIIIVKTKKAKDNIARRIIQSLKFNKKEKVEDEEVMEIKRFIETSTKSGVKSAVIKKELKEIGFTKEKITQAFR